MSTFTSNFGAMNTTPYGTSYRGIGTGILNSNAQDIAREDWIRNEQAAENQAARDLFIQERMAQKNYDLSRDYLRNQSLDLVEGLKAAGLNPILAVNNSGMSNLSSPSGGRTSSNNRSSSSSFPLSGSDIGNFLVAAGKLIVGIATKKPSFGFGK